MEFFWLLTPFLLYLTEVGSDHWPKTEINITRNISKRNVPIDASKRVDIPPVWSSRYYVKGTILLPFNNINETFEAWFDYNSGYSRIDYQNAKIQTYQNLNLGSFGSSFKVGRDDTTEETNTTRCLGVKGTNESRIFPQNILPDLRDYKMIQRVQSDGNNPYNNKAMVEKWFYISFNENSYSKHSMWLIRKKNVGYPLKYEVIVNNLEFKLHLDTYVITYINFINLNINPDAFNTTRYECEYLPSPGIDFVYNFNPMMEFINNYKDTFYFVAPIFEEFKRYNNTVHENGTVDNFQHELVFRHNLRYIHWKNRANVSSTLAVDQFSDRFQTELYRIT